VYGGLRLRQTRAVFCSLGARRIFLPPYSPDLDPIEQVFAKLKAALRKAQALSIETVIQEIARTLPSSSSEECTNYFRHSGYASM
jgi:transposase